MAGVQHRFAFVRNGAVAASEAFKQVLAAAGVDADTPATVLCDGDAGLWRLQRAALPQATVVLDWWHLAVHFEHALQAARGLGAGTAAGGDAGASSRRCAAGRSASPCVTSSALNVSNGTSA